MLHHFIAHHVFGVAAAGWWLVVAGAATVAHALTGNGSAGADTGIYIIIGAVITAAFPTAGLVIVARMNQRQTRQLDAMGTVSASTHKMVNQQRTEMLRRLAKMRAALGLPPVPDEQVLADAAETGPSAEVTAAKAVIAADDAAITAKTEAEDETLTDAINKIEGTKPEL